jgi:Rrf2 family protein
MLSKKTQYGLKALGYLAEKYSQGPVLIAEIAKAKKIPLKFLENILLLLKQNGVLDSKKGKGGGYYLSVAPKNISIARAIRIIDGPIALLPCVSINFYEKCADCDEENCGLKRTMALVRDATLKVLEKKNLTDLKDGLI